MAVSGKTTTYQVPYFLGTDKPPDMAAVTKAIAERVEALLAKGGDVSIAADGTMTIGAGKATESKLADGAVTSRKVKPTASVKEATSPLVLTGSFQDVAGTTLTITPAVVSLLLVTAVFFRESGSGAVIGTISVDGVDQAAHASLPTPGEFVQATASQIYAVSLSAAEHTIKMRAKQSNAAATLGNTHTRFSYLLVAS